MRQWLGMALLGLVGCTAASEQELSKVHQEVLWVRSQIHNLDVSRKAVENTRKDILRARQEIALLQAEIAELEKNKKR